jgi:hypothetical protein
VSNRISLVFFGNAFLKRPQKEKRALNVSYSGCGAVPMRQSFSYPEHLAGRIGRSGSIQHYFRAANV